MIRLDNQNRKLQAVLAGAVTTSQLPVTVSYVDRMVMPANAPTPFDQTNGAYKATNTNSATAVDIAIAPSNNATNIVREIDSIEIHNADTVAATVTIQYVDSATTYILISVALAVGDTLFYTHSTGWEAVDINGNTKR
mgnify:CR=1 FL=1